MTELLSPDSALVRLRRLGACESAGDRAAFARHLAGLDPGARACRFLGPVSPEAAARHAGAFDFGRALAVGAFAVAGGDLVGVVELHPCDSSGEWELAVSVDGGWRGRGVGRRLVDAGLAEAGRGNAARVALWCSPANRPMLGLVARLGGSVARDPDGMRALLPVQRAWNQAGEDDVATESERRGGPGL